jgi:hypothetical protein
MSNQAAAKKIRVCFLEPMARAGFIPSDDFRSLLEEELTGFGERDLKDAASHIIRTRTFSTFPMIGEIREAIRVVGDARLPAASRQRLDQQMEFEKRKLARRKACMRIRNTALGEPADREGWLHGLIDFVVAKDRMPDAEEQAELRRVAESLQKLPLVKPQKEVRGWTTLAGVGVSASLTRLREAMLKKAHTEVFGQAPKLPEPAPDAYVEAMRAVPDRVS